MTNRSDMAVKLPDFSGGVFMLSTENWRLVKEIFQTALELPSAERRGFIEKEAKGDELIKQEVESLLEAHDEAGSFIVEPAVAVTDFVENEQSLSLAGQQIGVYKILEEIGRGGMGAVYLAERADAEFEKKVALKLIKRGLDTDEIIRRFRNERQILANLEHPNIARLLDGGVGRDGLPFLVMEYVEGVPLARFCEENKLDLDERLELFLEVCAAVQYAHRNLIVHRDLKPSNILVAEEGKPKLLDFGIAKLLTPSTNLTTGPTATNFNLMTPEYASPEQVRGETVTTATDVYSLGIVLYEILTGERPYAFQSQSLEEVIQTVCYREPLKPSSLLLRSEAAGRIRQPVLRRSQRLRGDLDNIVLMAIRKEPERRYSSVEQFAGDIRRYQSGLPVIAREDSFAYRTEKFIRRNKIAVAAAGGVAISLLAGLAATTRQARIARRQRDKAAKINGFLQKMLASADPRAVGKDAKVIEVLQLAADSIEKEFAASPDIVADLSTTIGLTFLSLGQLDSAEAHLTEALEIRKKLFGLENRETALSLNNFGRLLQAQGNLKEAEKLFRQGLAILRQIRGTDSLDIASVLGNLGYLLMLEAQYEEAKNAHYEELEILRDRLDEDHFEFARTLGNLANIFSVTGEKQIAEPMHRQALRLTRNFYHGEHPDVALAMLHLAITITSDKPDEAESLFRESLALRRRFFGDGHTETAWAFYYLGDLLLRRGEYEAAAACARDILARGGHSIPETHLVINSTLLMLGRCYLAMDRPEEAEPVMRQCLELRSKTLPPEHWLIGTTKGYLAECFLQTANFEEAELLLRESYETLLVKLGEHHEHTKLARARLEKLADLTGK